MADLRASSTEIVPIKQYEDLRRKVTVPDSKSKTRKWLISQIQERIAKIEAFKGQKASIDGMMEVAEDELKELQGRLTKLEQLND